MYCYFNGIITMGHIHVNEIVKDNIQLAIFRDCRRLQYQWLVNKEFEYKNKNSQASLADFGSFALKNIIEKDKRIIKMFDNIKYLTKNDIKYLITKYKQDILFCIDEIRDQDMRTRCIWGFETLSYKKIN